MAKVLGFGGVFLKVDDPVAYCAWYKKALGVEITDWGTMMWGSDGEGHTMLSPFKSDTTYLAPSKQSFMINLRVDDVKSLIDSARSSGAEIVGEIESSEYGVFGWFIDPEGIKVELWQQPPASESAKP